MEAPIPSQVPRLPPWGRLEEVALHLAERRQYRDLITFVEMWAQQGVPTVPARLALCEAYLGLRLVDRAWSRLETLVDEGHGPLHAVRLAAFYLQLKGWPDQSRAMARLGLERDPNDPGLQRLLAESQQSSQSPEHLPEPQTLSALVRIAELYMSRGALVKAQGLLERARRKTHPRRVQRVEDLMWALLGDVSADSSLIDMCEALGPEHTASETTERLANPPHDPFDDPLHESRVEGFRQLFKGLDHHTSDEDTEDDTSVSRMAERNELNRTFADRSTDGGENTEILRVVRTTREPEPTSGSGSIPSETDYLPGAEYEDDDLVVVTRRAPTTPPPRRSPSLDRLTIDAMDEAEARSLASESLHRTPPRSRRRRRQPRKGDTPVAPLEDVNEPLWPWMLAAGVVLLGSLGVVFGIAALFGGR